MMNKSLELVLAQAISLAFLGVVFFVPVLSVERMSYSLSDRCQGLQVQWTDQESLGYRLFGMGYHTNLLPSYTPSGENYCNADYQHG